MVIKLTNQQLEDDIRSKIFKTLSEPIRIEILRFLKKKSSEVTCGEIGANVNITKSAASYHFKNLREAGLTFTRKESREKYVSINYEMFEKYLPHFLDTL
ncbi:winged helix-turn-helix transcriptional regulator [Lactococcus piscium]|uniref:ArsR/SmtB family transcription factor n=1 Tax=Pseudolactococcus carnosus TaxID=2749961 RepID=UPI001FBC143C|nr:winged helix-turn-helix domain-containing protein [Lactococcus carnosus]MCJ1995235.1 winged helix-turn-helix transcriptional regulator [Lactococcus carnosus]